MNHTLVESARSMLAHAGVPKMFWAKAISTAVDIRNRLPRAVKDTKIPHELWIGRKPNVSHMKVFGCIAYAHVEPEKRRKLDSKVEKMHFIGYSLTSKGYRLYHENKRRVFVRTTRRDIFFNEQKRSNTGKSR